MDSNPTLIPAILHRTEAMQTVKEELSIAKELLEEILDGDDEYHQLKEELDGLRKSFNLCKQALLNEPDVKVAFEKVKDKREHLSMIKEMRSGELLEFYRENRSLEISHQEKKYQISFKGDLK